MPRKSSNGSCREPRRCWPAKRQSALLVNADSAVLSCVLDDPEKLAVIEPIEGFRSLDEDMQAIVNKVGTCGIRQEVRRAAVENPEGKGEGRQVETQGGQQKPVKFATRIPFSHVCMPVRFL